MIRNSYLERHNGPSGSDIDKMLKIIGVDSLEELIFQVVPDEIRFEAPLRLPKPVSEFEYMSEVSKIAGLNKLYKTYIGTGYYGTITPSVIWRNMFENPAWYTSYTPYQAEISQGRLEALLNFQTVVTELTGMQLANASLLDEATAAAEAVVMMSALRSRQAVKNGANTIFVDKNSFPQILAVIEGKAEAFGFEVEVGDFTSFEIHDKVFGAVVQYPAGDGAVEDYSEFAQKLHDKQALLAVAADILSLTLLTPPSEWGADIVFGSTQRFGIPMGFGGPHAAYFATKEEYKRNTPGRIIGISVDAKGNRALRMALQTREQHIKREKATSNICTAQALLANMAGMYAVYHGAEGLKKIAVDIHKKAVALAVNLADMDFEIEHQNLFDTINVRVCKKKISKLKKAAEKARINFRYIDKNHVGISIDETTQLSDLNDILHVFANVFKKEYIGVTKLQDDIAFENKFIRKTPFLQQDVFRNYHTETEMMRYIKRLERKDISLTHSMISLGSCTMKLNSASVMMPLSNKKFGNLHPFVPENQAKGYKKIVKSLKHYLLEITGFSGITFQPNSGAAGEYTGLRIINAYHKSRGEAHRNIALIPASAHGTNPASAVMAGMDVVVVNCDANGNIDQEDLKQKAEKHKDNLAAFMITYPSTHGVFEKGVMDMCEIIHKFGGQVYMDGANMNAQVGITSPGRIGADVCHLNLHKTFAIPHGGGGPGVGPVAVAKHLTEFLPTHPIVKSGGKNGIKAVAAAPYGSASVLPITYGYLRMLGSEALTRVTEVAILNANYLASKLSPYYKTLYVGGGGRVAHEMILECRNIKHETGISEADIAKRLMDYGFHAPTLSFPVHGTLMVEPTESESLTELDRFADAMISIYNEIEEVRNGTTDKENNVLKNAPHSEAVLLADTWSYPYSREKAAYPMPYLRSNKFQIPVSRLDDAYGDRNLVCTCAPIEAYIEKN